MPAAKKESCPVMEENRINEVFSDTAGESETSSFSDPPSPLGSSSEKKSRKIPKKIIIAAAAAAAVIIAYCILCACVKNSDTILANISADGVDLSGLNVSQAAALLEEELTEDLEATEIQVTALDQTYSVSIGSVLETDWEALAQECYSKGHSSFIAAGMAWLICHMKSTDYESSPYAAYEDKLYDAYEDCGITEINTTVEASWEATDETVYITLGTSGLIPDTDALSELILAAVEDGDFESIIECPMEDLSPEDVDLEAIYDEIYIEPTNATLDPDDDYSIVESIDGVSFDLESAQTIVDAASEGETVEIELIYTEPDIDTANLEANLFTDTLGSYTTSVSGSSARRSNVKLAASSCEVILLPGETFSYNDTVGERTAARGYQEAAAYLNGETVQELGGGVCQVSSTLYVACLYANLEIVERHAHTYASSYVPLGWDATVSWGGPDFQFTNNTNYPIKITATYSSSNKLTMSIIGTDETGYTVEIVSETLSTTAYETQTIEDSTLSSGTTVVEQTGYTGYKVQTWRYVYDSSGNLISDDEEAYSSYSKRNRIVRVGTKEEETETETEETEEAEASD